MARVAFPLVLQSPSSGSAIVGANATITQHVVGQSLGSGPAATIYTSETGAGVTPANQISTDNLGRWTQGQSAGYAQYWLDENTYDIVISGSGLTAFTITRELLSAKPQLARAYLQTGPILNSGWAKVGLDSETFDPGANFDTALHRYVAPVGGYYLVHAAIGVQYNNNPQLLQAGIRKNGVLLPGQAPETWRGLNSADGLMVRVTDLVSCNAGDYLELYLYNGGSNAVQVLGAGVTYMTVSRQRG